MLAMFKDVELPHDNERALGLLTRINILWDENSWLAGKKHQTRHLSVSHEAQKKIIEVVLVNTDTVEELLNDEICIHQFIEWVLQNGEEVDF